jgi:maltose O-acetyltransferase
VLIELPGAFGAGSEIRPPFRCDYGYQTRIGTRTFANWGLVSLDVAPVTIGDDVQIGPNVQLLTATHPVEPQPRREKWEAAQPIVIGDNVWLGAGVIVCPGVTIGANTVVGAGAVVTRDLPANAVAVGTAARIIRPGGRRWSPGSPRRRGERRTPALTITSWSARTLSRPVLVRISTPTASPATRR